MKEFNLWKKWFLGLIRKEIARGAGVVAHDGILLKRMLVPRRRNTKHERKVHDKFLLGFIILCEKNGFRPDNDIDCDQFDLNEGHKVWMPKTGKLCSASAKLCYLFYQMQRQEIEREIENMKRWDKEVQSIIPQRTRLPIDIAKAVLYYLEKFNGDAEKLEILRLYFSKEFRRDLCVVVRRPLHKQIRSRKNKTISVVKDNPTLKAIEKLYVHRGDLDRRTWATHRRQELWRNVLSKGKPRIIKSYGLISFATRSKMRDQLLAEGDREIFR